MGRTVLLCPPAQWEPTSAEGNACFSPSCVFPTTHGMEVSAWQLVQLLLAQIISCTMEVPVSMSTAPQEEYGHLSSASVSATVLPSGTGWDAFPVPKVRFSGRAAAPAKLVSS